MRRIQILTLLLLLQLATPALAEVILTERTEYYPVEGIGKNELIKNLEKRAPHKKGNDTYPAYTKTDIKSEYSWQNQGGRCSVTKVTVRLNLTYVYPRLAQTQSRKTMKWWKEMLAKFETHELIHGDISKRSAYELDRKLRSMNDINCTNAKQTISSRVQYITRQMKKKQAEYDRITEHGRQQHKYKRLR